MSAIAAPLLDRAAFLSLLATAKPGQWILYHVGSLMRDRLRGSAFQKAHSTACAVWDAMEAGKVELVQQRVGPRGSSEFNYFAIVKAPPHTKVTWSGCYGEHHK